MHVAQRDRLVNRGGGQAVQTVHMQGYRIASVARSRQHDAVVTGFGNACITKGARRHVAVWVRRDVALCDRVWRGYKYKHMYQNRERTRESEARGTGEARDTIVGRRKVRGRTQSTKAVSVGRDEVKRLCGRHLRGGTRVTASG